MVNFDQTLGIYLGHPHSMWGFWDGPADGEICNACDKPITKQQLITEGIASTLSDKKPIQFHVRCFQFWDTERRAPKSQPSRAYSASR